MDITTATPESVLKKYFGYDSFRPLQRDIISEVMQGHDVLALMPTGGGKSICYQVPALLRQGTAIVISPLIALMKDQVEALRVNGIRAAYLNSALSLPEVREVERLFLGGHLDLLYVSPEKLLTDSFLNDLQRVQISMFAVDEAHCISFWGHDFRPEYKGLGIIKKRFPHLPIIALTATADKLTRKDILVQLAIEDARTFIASFDRPNLFLRVAPGLKRMQQLIRFLSIRPNRPGIVYCLSRKSTESIAEKLRVEGYRAEAYHAGLPASKRNEVQEAFLRDDIQIVVATIAFGMGIDKSNVRFVVHYNLPKNIESYYQEIGRCGRDGASAEALLFYTYSDVAQQQQMLGELSDHQRELQQAKLDRLQQFVESVFCRRQILLNYFSEEFEGECGQCDNCQEPRATIDGTVIAQKALSAVARAREQLTINGAIDILRGHRNQDVMQKGWHTLRTFGAGREYGPLEWRDYLQQLTNLGLLDIAYDQGHHLHLTHRSRKVLFDNESVQLAKAEFGQAKAAPQPVETVSKAEVMEEGLFEKLRALRKKIADMQGLPPYIIFNDNTLREMAKYKPTTREAILEISGVGVNKFEQYGDDFIDAIIDFINGQMEQGNRTKGSTYLVTYQMLSRGLDPQAVARERKLSLVTVYSHIGQLYETGHAVDLDQYLSFSDRASIIAAIPPNDDAPRPKDLLEKLEGAYDFWQVRLALAWWKREHKAA